MESFWRRFGVETDFVGPQPELAAQNGVIGSPNWRPHGMEHCCLQQSQTRRAKPFSRHSETTYTGGCCGGRGGEGGVGTPGGGAGGNGGGDGGGGVGGAEGGPWAYI